DADAHRHHQIHGDGDDRGDDEDDTIGTGGTQYPGRHLQVDHAGGGDHEDTRQGGQGDHGHHAGGQVDHRQQHQCVDDGRDPGATTGADVDGGAGDRTGGRHATEESGADGGEPLAHQ